jgi:hypothetical protein
MKWGKIGRKCIQHESVTYPSNVHPYNSTSPGYM